MLEINEQGLIIYSKEILRQLDDVNWKINDTIYYKSDMEIYNTPDFWTIVNSSDKYGDCEDFALTKRFKLLKLGWPRNCLKLATCWVEGRDGAKGTGPYHAVLTVDTTKGTFVLDNRREMVFLWTDLPYKWDKREVPSENMWEQIIC